MANVALQDLYEQYLEVEGQLEAGLAAEARRLWPTVRALPRNSRAPVVNELAAVCGEAAAIHRHRGVGAWRAWCEPVQLRDLAGNDLTEARA